LTSCLYHAVFKEPMNLLSVLLCGYQ